jgi:hypothetical protein
MENLNTKQERLARITIFYSQKLTEIVERYYDNTSDDIKANEALLIRLNNEWKHLVKKANRLNTGLNLLFDAFEKTITRNHYIMLILQKESRLSGEYLNRVDDSLLIELSTNDEQLEAFTLYYLDSLRKQQADQFKSSLKVVK